MLVIFVLVFSHLLPTIFDRYGYFHEYDHNFILSVTPDDINKDNDNLFR